MRIGYLECFAGISGDMLLGALVDAGISAELLQQTAESLHVEAALAAGLVDRSGIRSTKVDVKAGGEPADVSERREGHGAHAHYHDGHTHEHEHDHRHSHTHGRNWREIRELIGGTPLREDAKALALRAFGLLAEAEGRIHGVPAEEVH